MSLYASKKAIEITIRLFTELHECQSCGKFFTEMENVGCWDCWYHPGEYDYDTDKWTCCGNKYSRPMFHHRGYGHMMTWTAKDKYNHVPPLTKGCCRRDCQSIKKTAIPTDVLPVNDIATLIPYMQRKVDKRPGLKKAPLRLERKEERPPGLWDVEPI
jgi:hypothetical protein